MLIFYLNFSRRSFVI